MDTSSEKKQKFVKVYNDNADAVYRRCYFKTSNEEKAKDLTQEAFVKLWDYFEKDTQIDNPKALVFKIANNLIIDHYRKKKSQSLDDLLDAGLSFSDEIDHESIVHSTEVDFAMSIINELPEIYKEVVTLRYVEEMSPDEISEILGESRNVISVRIHRGVKKIKKLLNKKESEN